MNEPIRVGSVCSGIAGLDLGFDGPDYKLRWMCERDEHCQSVLRRQFPTVRIHHDLQKLHGFRSCPEGGCRNCATEIDLLIGGTPCQSFSVAGNREGMDGESGLFLQFARLADELNPTWTIWENVPGVLSLDKGEVFADILEDFSGCRPVVPKDRWRNSGWGFGPKRAVAWRICDAQHFGVPQRRRRIFVVASSGIPRSSPQEVLFEPEGMQGDSAESNTKEQNTPSGTAGSPGSDSGFRRGRTEDVVAALSSTGVGVGGPDDNQAQAGHLIVPEIAGTLGGGRRGWNDDFDRAGAFIGYPSPARTVSSPVNGPRYDFESETLAYSVYPESGQGANLRATKVDVVPALTATAEAASTDRGVRVVQAIAENQRAELRTSDVSLQITTGGGKPGQGYPAVMIEEKDKPTGYVRRLTPLECERLQGFPDKWTLTTDAGKTIADSPRYRMIGNAVAVPVAKWIGERLARVHKGEENEHGV